MPWHQIIALEVASKNWPCCTQRHPKNFNNQKNQVSHPTGVQKLWRRMNVALFLTSEASKIEFETSICKSANLATQRQPMAGPNIVQDQLLHARVDIQKGIWSNMELFMVLKCLSGVNISQHMGILSCVGGSWHEAVVNRIPYIDVQNVQITPTAT